MRKQTKIKGYFSRCIFIAAVIFTVGVVGSVLPGQTPILIAVVKPAAVPQYDLAMEGFADILAEKNITARIETYEPGDKEVIKKIKSKSPALILTIGTAATKLVSENIHDIPIVFSMIMHPRKSGITSRDIAGASLDIPVKVQLANLETVAPGIKTVGVLYSPAESRTIIDEAKQAAAQLGLILKDYPVRSPKEIPKISGLKIDALWMVPDTVVCRDVIVRRIFLSSLRRKIPVMGISPSYARSGALLALSCDYRDIGRQSGEIALKLLEGTDYPDLEITVPRKIKLYLNETVAHRLGI
ncbi:MAG: hypothetical protein GY950_28820, partial [bacterium]|nr:hypothetical protein [bacterium]